MKNVKIQQNVELRNITIFVYRYRIILHVKWVTVIKQVINKILLTNIQNLIQKKIKSFNLGNV